MLWYGCIIGICRGVVYMMVERNFFLRVLSVDLFLIVLSDFDFCLGVMIVILLDVVFLGCGLCELVLYKVCWVCWCLILFCFFMVIFFSCLVFSDWYIWLFILFSYFWMLWVFLNMLDSVLNILLV